MSCWEQKIGKKNWRDILKRILNCIKFLVSKHFALRGHESHLHKDEDKNVGNFLSVIKFVAQYDPLLEKNNNYNMSEKIQVQYLIYHRK